METREIEAKFYVRDLNRVAAWLKQAGAQCLQARVFEHNLRFDLPGGELQRQGCVLRLRRDAAASLTFKGASQKSGGVVSRAELEFRVSDFEAARAFLEALGYHVVAVYEKYRAVYQYQEFHIMLDELPFGDFVEIEGAGPPAIQRCALELGLDPAKAVSRGYLALHKHLCASRPLDPASLTFAALQGLRILPQELGVDPADG